VLRRDAFRAIGALGQSGACNGRSSHCEYSRSVLCEYSRRRIILSAHSLQEPSRDRSTFDQRLDEAF
jgi:hypothetical protein